MKLLFSEHKPDYGNYIFPYAIWAVPEHGESPADLFNAGFLPSSRDLDRFYLCRHVRVNLARFQPSSENRRVLRKGSGIRMELVPRAQFAFTPARREFHKNYADIKFGKDTMSFARLDALFAAPIISHLLVFTDEATGGEVGVATLYLQSREMVYYYYAFYDLNYYSRNLGMFMMTQAVTEFAARGCEFAYLGTCYSDSAIYKTQFTGTQFFNGVRWSDNLKELKFILRRGQGEYRQHLLEDEGYWNSFASGNFRTLTAASGFSLQLSKGGPKLPTADPALQNHD